MRERWQAMAWAWGAAAVIAMLAAACGDEALTTNATGSSDADVGGGIAGNDGGFLFDISGGPQDSGPIGGTKDSTGGAETAGDDGGGVDAGPAFVCEEAGGFLCDCETNAQCQSGYCLPTADGNKCTEACLDSCPAGWKCSALAGLEPGSVYVCEPPYPFLCDPCTDSKDCGFVGQANACVASDGGAGSFCGTACKVDSDCPPGYGCDATATPSAQCRRTTGECACSKLATQLGLQTDCSVTNENGTCTGTRRCDEAGLTACDAKTPAAETCNGEDDDCNGTVDDIIPADCSAEGEAGTCAGKTFCDGGAEVCSAAAPKAETCNTLDDDCDGAVDEDTCADEVPCTDDLCTDTGNCKHPVTAGSCLISGACVDAGAINPQNPCQKCEPSKSTTTWTAANGVPCDDGKACTNNDLCAAGACAGTAYTCDDGLTCTDDACDGLGGCTTPITAGACLIAGQCQTAGATKPGGGCLVCAPGISTTDWTASEGASCDDGDPCTLSDTCNGGLCTGKAINCSSLGDSCNLGICVGGACAKSPVPGGCDDNNPCTTSDQCVAGVCVGTPMDCSGFDTQCKKGVCQGGQCTAQNVTGPCNDQEACTDNDQCVQGECQGTAKDCSNLSDTCNVGICTGGTCGKLPKPGSCNDGDTCTVNDACFNGICAGTPKDCSAQSDACNVGICAAGLCVKNPVNNNCSDGDSCTTGDKCVGGQCVGTALNCTGLNDQCNTGVCVGGTCKAQPKTASCNDNDSCTSNDTCSNGVCGGTPMTDAYEPNNTYIGKAITNISDCDDSGKYSLSATLYPSGDEDWFYFKVSDNTGCDVQPQVELAVPSGVDYDLCAYFECNNGDDSSDLDCLTGTKVSGPKAKTSGCCSTKTGSQSETVRISPSCSFLGTGDESGYIDVRIYKKSGTATCTPYTLKWGDS